MTDDWFYKRWLAYLSGKADNTDGGRSSKGWPGPLMCHPSAPGQDASGSPTSCPSFYLGVDPGTADECIAVIYHKHSGVIRVNDSIVDDYIRIPTGKELVATLSGCSNNTFPIAGDEWRTKKFHGQRYLLTEWKQMCRCLVQPADAQPARCPIVRKHNPPSRAEPRWSAQRWKAKT